MSLVDSASAPAGSTVSTDRAPVQLSTQSAKPVQQAQTRNPAAIGLSRVAVIIPVLNEVESLPLVLDDLPAGVSVIVVNNGSTDATAEVARQGGATVIDEPQRGYGKACLSGLAEVERMVREDGVAIEVIAFVDGDYSDHVHLLDQIVLPILRGQEDFVLGSRLTGEREKGAMPPQSVWGNRLACTLMNWFFKGSYTDLGPMRAVRRSALQEIEMVDENFGWTIEMQIKALRHQLRILEIPVPYRCRIGTSKISGTISGSVRAGVKILYSIWHYGLRRHTAPLFVQV